MVLNAATVTADEVRALLEAGDDSVHNQVRVTRGGEVYLSRQVGTEALDGLAFRYETLAAGGGYVGAGCDPDGRHSRRLAASIRQQWAQFAANPGGPGRYIDIY